MFGGTKAGGDDQLNNFSVEYRPGQVLGLG